MKRVSTAIVGGVRSCYAACRTVRARLTLVYGGVFLAAGGALLIVTDILVRHFANTLSSSISETVKLPLTKGSAELQIGGGGALSGSGTSIGNTGALPTSALPAGQVGVPVQYGNTVVRLHGGQVPGPTALTKPTVKEIAYLRAQANDLISRINAQHYAVTHSLFVFSLLAFAGIAVLAVVLGWLMAGRALRPLRSITNSTRAISARNLHERLAYAGPADEVKELADTVDHLLERLEGAFEAQRRFVANASHELLTPLARQRTLAEVALGDGEATVASLRAAHERVLAAGEQQEQLIDALLTLARSDRGLDRRSPVDVGGLARDAIDARRPAVRKRGIAIEGEITPAIASGDAKLIERLIDNLLDNAIDHNVREGWVEVSTSTDHGRTLLRVTNSGPVIPKEEIARLLQPFQRLGRDRTGSRDHHGLGLAIVQAIVSAHEGEVAFEPLPDGGLRVDISLPSTEEVAKLGFSRAEPLPEPTPVPC
jgi:signal transduction histidine kinase